MIEILEVKTVGDAANNIPATRHADIIISSGPTAYLWSVGGLPPSGNLQTILDAREAELWTAAQVGGRAVDLYEVTTKRVLKAFALVMLDEINILRQASVPPLPVRSGAMIEAALRAKLKAMP